MAKLDNEDVRTLVKQYVKASGLLKDAWVISGYADESGFFAYLREHPEFHEELNKIKRFADPTVSINLVEMAMKAIEDNLQHGAFKKISDVNKQTGKSELTRTIQTGASKWAVELVLSQPKYTEAALKMIIASQVHSITHDDTWTDEQRKTLYEFLAKFKRQELLELIKNGVAVKDDIQ